MHEPTLLADDPLITAYALGELDGEDRGRVAAAVRATPALQGAVAEISLLATALGSAMAHEAAAPLLASAASRRSPRPSRQPVLAVLAWGLTAAALLVIFAGPRPSPVKKFGPPSPPEQIQAPVVARVQPAVLASQDRAVLPAGFGDRVDLSAFWVEGNLVLERRAANPSLRARYSIGPWRFGGPALNLWQSPQAYSEFVPGELPLFLLPPLGLWPQPDTSPKQLDLTNPRLDLTNPRLDPNRWIPDLGTGGFGPPAQKWQPPPPLYFRGIWDAEAIPIGARGK